MDRGLLEKLREITPEEQTILDGRTTIDRELYMQGRDDTVSAGKLLSAGRQITIRPHTRFIHFPAHTHDYVEMVYMCAGSTTHLAGGARVTLEQGDLLFLCPGTTHEVCRAEEGDVAVNFIVLPDFFSTALAVLGEEETPLRRFLVDCLCGQHTGPGYLHFAVAGVKPIENLVENLLWTLTEETPNRLETCRMTMTLLFLQLLGHAQSLTASEKEDTEIIRVLQYVETCYVQGSFGELCGRLHYDPSWLSRQIKRKTGKTFTELMQGKRLAQAAFLLKNTDCTVAEISAAVGYENLSYFHRMFRETYGRSPRHYRLQERTLF